MKEQCNGDYLVSEQVFLCCILKKGHKGRHKAIIEWDDNQ
jgi:hypothetical protein